MATYKEIQKFVKNRYGFTVKTCWIADAKEKSGLNVKRAHNRQEGRRLHPCPQSKLKTIQEAFSYFGMLQ